MNEKYVKDVVGSISDFCDIYNSYDTELGRLSVSIEEIERKVNEFKNDPERNEASKNSYNALSDDIKYHSRNGDIIEYDSLTIAQIRELDKTTGFIHDEGLDYEKEIGNIEYEMNQSAKKIVSDLEDKLREVNRAKSRLVEINLQNAADIARNQNLIDDCIYEQTRTTDAKDKQALIDRIKNANKDIKKLEVLTRINTTIMSSSSLIAGVFSDVIDGIKTNKAVDVEHAEDKEKAIEESEAYMNMVDKKLDILSDLSKLMASFQTLKADYEKEKEIINDINAKCKEIKKTSEDKDIRSFANAVMKNTKDYSKLIEYIENYNKTAGKSNTEEEQAVFEPPIVGGPTPEPTSEQSAETQEEEKAEESKQEQTAENKEEEKAEENKEEQTAENKEEEKAEENKEEQTAENKEEEKAEENKEEQAQEQQSNDNVENEVKTQENTNTVLTPGMDAERMIKIKSTRRHFVGNTYRTLLIAGFGLGFLAPGLLPTAMMGLGGAALGYDVWDRARDVYQRKVVEHKLNKVAKKATKDLKNIGYKNLKIKVKELVNKDTKELTGELRYAIYDGGIELGVLSDGLASIVTLDGVIVPLNNIKNDIQGYLNEEFSKINDPEERKGTNYETYNYKKVDLENLEAAYVEYGGYKVAKDGKSYDQISYSDFGKKVVGGVKDVFSGIRRDIDKALDDDPNQAVSNENTNDLLKELDNDQKNTDAHEMAAAMTVSSAVKEKIAEWEENLELEGLNQDDIANYESDLTELLNNNVQGYTELIDLVDNKQITTVEEFNKKIQELKSLDENVDLSENQGISR